ncbi:MAG: type IV toxin-antitoxin system AbiEi family antitoxin domain-containing protein [Planctomycetes bacterium]|nr:type IV toxin-antitoxin system AbiEi family antitoxin domain-containing protein [Planctomycetota bacterium]
MAARPDLTPRGLERAGLGAYFRPRDVEALGVTEPMLRTLLRRGVVEKVARGLYRLTAAPASEHEAVAATCARVPRGIVCLLTALQIHEIGTRLSAEVWLGIPHGTRSPLATVARLRIVRFSGPMLSAGVEPIRIDGVPTRITNPARTIVDCLRLTSLIDRETALEALREGLRTRRATSNGLLRMARACGTFERVRRDLEVLNA